MQLPASGHPLSEQFKKRRVGIFHTPIDAERILCDWAIRSSGDRVLEPSFGGGFPACFNTPELVNPQRVCMLDRTPPQIPSKKQKANPGAGLT